MPSVNEFLEAYGVMISRLWRHGLQKHICKALPSVVIRLCDFVVSVDIASFLNVERAAIYAIDACHKLKPCFRLKQVIQPQSAP